MDGVDQWTMIKDGGASARQEIVCNLDIYSDLAPPISGRAAIRSKIMYFILPCKENSSMPSPANMRH